MKRRIYEEAYLAIMSSNRISGPPCKIAELKTVISAPAVWALN